MNASQAQVEVRCHTTADGWRCELAVDDGDGGPASPLTMTVTSADALSLAGVSSQAMVERLAFETVQFLLEREPIQSILRTFDVTVVGRYFPEFESEIRSRLAP